MVDSSTQLLPFSLLAPFASQAFGKRIPTSTLRGWVHRGVRGVRLESVLLGGRRYNFLAAVQRFLDALNLRQPPHHHAPAHSSE